MTRAWILVRSRGNFVYNNIFSLFSWIRQISDYTIICPKFVRENKWYLHDVDRDMIFLYKSKYQKRKMFTCNILRIDIDRSGPMYADTCHDLIDWSPRHTCTRVVEENIHCPLDIGHCADKIYLKLFWNDKKLLLSRIFVFGSTLHFFVAFSRLIIPSQL